MEPLIGAQASQKDLVKDSDAAHFAADVIEASQNSLVLVDFWATWCGPCKTLGPLLEKVVREMRGQVRLVKIDVDKNPQLAGQLRIQTVPMVYAFKDGRPVDGFSGALAESQVRSFVQRHLGRAQGQSLPDLLKAAQETLDAGQAEEAALLFQEILAEDSTQVAAVAGLLRCLLAMGEVDQARQLLDRVPPDMAGHDAIKAVRTALELQGGAANADTAELAALRRDLDANPDHHDARFRLAVALYAAGQEEAAVDELLALFARDREWNDRAAQKQLLKIFEALGFTHPVSVRGRRDLSTLMFA